MVIALSMLSATIAMKMFLTVRCCFRFVGIGLDHGCVQICTAQIVIRCLQNVVNIR